MSMHSEYVQRRKDEEKFIQATVVRQLVMLPREQPLPSFRGDGQDQPAEEWTAEVLRVVQTRAWPAAKGYRIRHLPPRRDGKTGGPCHVSRPDQYGCEGLCSGQDSL